MTLHTIIGITATSTVVINSVQLLLLFISGTLYKLNLSTRTPVLLHTNARTVVDVQSAGADSTQVAIQMKPADKDVTRERDFENHVTHRVLHADRARNKSQRIMISHYGWHRSVRLKQNSNTRLPQSKSRAVRSHGARSTQIVSE